MNRHRPSRPHPIRRDQRLALATAGLVGATLASSVLVTADAASVFGGESLPQVLLMLLTGVVASFSSLPVTPFAPAVSSQPAGRRRWSIGAWLWLALMLGLVIATLSATWLANGRAAWNGFWHVVGLLVFGTVVRSLCRQRGLAVGCAQLLLTTAIVLSAHSVHQLAISMPETRAAYERDPEKALAELHLDAPPGSATRAQYESRLHSTEPLATFALTNSLAVLLSAALVGLTIWIAYQLQASGSSRVALAAAVVAWALVAAIWLLTKSRTAYLAVAVVFAGAALVAWRSRTARASGVLARRHQAGWLAAAAVALVALIGGLAALLMRDKLIVAEALKSLSYRVEYWQATLGMIGEHPLAGVGLGNFQSYYPRYKLPGASEVVADPHNWMLDIAATCSAPVLVLVLVGLAVALMQSWHGLQSQLRTDAPAEPAANSSGDREALALESKLARWLGWGAALGWLLTAGLAWVLRASIDLEGSTLGLVVGLALMAAMRSARPAPDALWQGMGLAAVATMLLCLLASGSWQASGLAIPLATWLGIAGGAASLEGRTGQAGAGSAAAEKPGIGPARGTMATRAIASLLLLGFLVQAWRPVNSSWTESQAALAALSNGELSAARQAALASIAADPIDPAPRRLLLEIVTLEAVQQPAENWEQASESVREAIDQLLACDPAAYGNWTVSGEALLTLAAAAEMKFASDRGSPGGWPPEVLSLVEQAEAKFAGASERYPSHVGLHAQRAVVLALLDRDDEARRELDAALSLSENTPHLDRKLGMQRVWLPPGLSSGRFPDSAIVRPSPGAMSVAAEPICDFLRNRLNT